MQTWEIGWIINNTWYFAEVQAANYFAARAIAESYAGPNGSVGKCILKG